MTGPTTLEMALRPHAIEREEIVRRYPGPSALVRRILGVVPNAVSYFEIWPPSLVTYNLTVPALLDVPKCDMGMGISPELRALVAHAASRGFGCRYCTAHTALMGTVIRGPLNAPEILSRVSGVGDLDSLGPEARVAAQYAAAAAGVPAPITTKHRDALNDAFRPNHVEAIVLVVAGMGYLNRFMDSLGTVLETAVLNAVEDPLGSQNWDPGKHLDSASDRDSNARLARTSRVRLMREIPQAVAYEMAALSNVPKTPSQIGAAVSRAVGFVPYYFDSISRGGVRRVFAHYWLERLCATGVEVSGATKLVMAWIVAKAASNPALAAHFAFAAHHAGVDIPALTAALRPPDDPSVSPDAAAFALAHATSGTAGDVPSPVIEALMRRHTPPSIIELLCVLSVACALQRFTVSLPPPRGYEPEVATFVAQHGDALGLPRALPSGD